MSDNNDYHCTILEEKVLGRVCDARRMKANIAHHNSLFRHRLTDRQIKECLLCKEGPRGLVKVTAERGRSI
jgi:hypothetical protein